MRRRTVVLVLVAASLVVFATPAWGGATPLARIKKLEKQVRGLAVLVLSHDQVSATTIEAPITWNQNYGTGSALCPPSTQVTGGGVRWTGPTVGIDSAVISSYSTGVGWTANVRAGAGTTAGAYVQAVCTSLR